MKFTEIVTSTTFLLDEARSDYASRDYDNDEGKVKFVGLAHPELRAGLCGNGFRPSHALRQSASGETRYHA